MYSKAASVGIRSALNRHLTATPFSRPVRLSHDTEFMSSNHVFAGIIKDQIRKEKDVTKHKEAISAGDLARLYPSDTLPTANAIWFD